MKHKEFSKHMKISISGTPGSGKSTLAKELAKKLGYKHYSGGDMRGMLAMKLGITIDELNKRGETDPSTDKQADEAIAEIGKKKDNFVIDSRLAWHFIPDSFKIFLTADENIAAKRIFRHAQEKGRPDEKKYKSIEEVREAIKHRQESDKLRYKKWYGLDHTKPENYDLVIDTTGKEIEQVVQEVLGHLNL